MADLKISQLTGATTPLAGTEVLPIVQSSSTKKVAVDDLTVKNVRSNATTGILQVAGPTAATTRVMTVPDANFTAARTDAAQSFTGDQTLGTGNLIQGTAAKGFNFTANTGAAGKTSNLLNWYEEGTWTPTDGSGAGLTFTNVTAKYTRIGRAVTITLSLTYPATADASQAKISGLPFAVSNFGLILFLTPGNVNGNGQAFIGASGTTLDLYAQNGAIKTNANMTAAQPVFTGTYFV